MILFIDGDNSYKQRIEGIEYLTKNDVVNFYYNKNNSSINGQPKGNIKGKCKSKLNFIQVDSASQAVDFRIAVDAARESNGNVIGVISSDNHFKTIYDSLTSDGKHGLVHYGRSVKDVLDYKLMELDNLEDYLTFVQNTYTKDTANKLIRNIIKISKEIHSITEEVYK